MFLTSKLLALLTQPLAWVITLLLAGLLVLQRKPRTGRRLVGVALVVVVVMGWQPLPNLLIHHLESQYAEMTPQADLRGYAGVVVLGGALESGHVSQGHVQPLLNDGAERMTAPVALLQRNPHLRVVFTGGEGALFGTGPNEAQRTQVFAWVKAKAGSISPVTGPSSSYACAVRLCAVFKHQQVVRISNFKQFLHVGQLTIQVHGQNSAGLGSQRCFHAFRA